MEPPAVTIREASVDEALGVEARIPEFGGAYPAQTYAVKLAGRPHLILVAEVGGEAVGYKVGFALDDTLFYSWLGGVVPGHRRLGVAGALRLYQERWARERGVAVDELERAVEANAARVFGW